ncbi:hypothetical protein L3Y34_006594 [Caenorhabditis briggsae]|uniref:G-protein coupled receptors family 1 profile domain-containing protein n=1 Tax=Caenorhabditis briggsae TaxID=6238 RepID=A0AAE9A1R5_CAEBR|nr:hypothetical protein L3Y34_006594 [Caenorhabditis briggsae]
MTSFFTTPSPASNLDKEQMYLEEWMHSSRLLFYSVICISLFTLPILAISLCYIRFKIHLSAHFLPYFYSILIANFILLTTLFASVIAKNTESAYDAIPGLLVCKLAAFLVNSSSSFIHWTWVAMFAERCFYFYSPLRYRVYSSFRTKSVITGIAIFSMCIQFWIPIFITEKRLIGETDNIYCGEEPSHSSQTQLILFLECICTFFLPLILTILADISIFTWKSSWGGISFNLVPKEEIQGKSSDSMKIVSLRSVKNSKKRRINAIRRCLISATITLFLNLPNYSLQLLDEFFNFRESESIDVRRIFLRIDAFVYILFLMQFPITPIHIFTLSRTRTRKASYGILIF